MSDPRNRILIRPHQDGIGYYDLEREERGDYRRLAFLPFDTLELKLADETVPTALRQEIERDAARLQDRIGQRVNDVVLGAGLTRRRWRVWVEKDREPYATVLVEAINKNRAREAAERKAAAMYDGTLDHVQTWRAYRIEET